MRSRLLKVVLAASFFVLPGRAQADPVRLQDLELLIEGGVGDGVILRHLERWGLERDLEAAELVALKKAGASDALLEELAGTPGEAGSGERVVSLVGGRGVLITNLDEQGRRIGGEEPQAAPVNRVEAAEPPLRRAGAVEEPVAEERISRVRPPVEEAALPYERAGFGPCCEGGVRWGTPGGYTRFKMYYSRAPYDGFRTWVLPVAWVPRGPFLFTPGWSGAFAPPFLIY